jgi:hypothetical protein
MENPQLQNLIYNLTEIQNICNRLSEIENKKQSDSDLVKVLKQTYTLSKEETASILSTVYGKTKEKKSKDDTSVLKRKLEAFCEIAEVICYDESGKLLAYKKIKDKATAKKSIANDKLKSAVV